jgi:hypothetical protein
LDSLITDNIQFFNELMHISGPTFAIKEGQKISVEDQDPLPSAA